DTLVTLTATVTVGDLVVTRDIIVNVIDANDSIPLSVAEALLLADGDSVLIVGVITGAYYDERIIQGPDGSAIWVDSNVEGDIGDEIVVRGILSTYTSNGNNVRQLDSATKTETLSVGNALVIDAETNPDVIVTKYSEQKTYTATLTVDSFDSYGYIFFDTGTEAMKLKFSSFYASYFEDVYAVGDTVVVTFTILDVSYGDVRMVNIVLPELTEAQNMLGAKGELTVPATVLTDISLPTENVDFGATIVWASNDTAITTAGVVTRPANGDGDATVTLTATVTVGALVEDVVFTVTVTEEPAPFVAVGTEIFISEYIEGSNSNKAIELFNPTAAPITLTGYSIVLYSNGSATGGNTIALDDFTIQPGDVLVVYNSSAWSEIADVGDVTSNITYFNGDDAVALVKDTVVIDVIGVIGEDPGSSWVVGTGSTGEHTLVRAATVFGPNATWTPGEWVVFDQNTFTYLGAHVVTPA
ncbi:MAG: lamin tail domain-containing protein, partial [Candidatus Izimaplasma sp.]|nr:lamin tail domain-containing protein [Candidatus Izimaplasma bacterium]